MLKRLGLAAYLVGLGVLLLWVPEYMTIGDPRFRSDTYDFIWRQDPMRVHYVRILYDIVLWSWACAAVSAVVLICERGIRFRIRK